VISFVIPAYNEARLLDSTLRALHAAARKAGLDYEVIVADDASSDATAQVARENGARVVPSGRRQIAATRNAGARAARGDQLIFVDADTVVNPEVLSAAYNSMKNGAVGGGAGVHFAGRLPWYARAIQGPASLAFRLAGLAAGCFMFATRDAFEAAGGFDERLYGAEEIALSKALKRQGRFVVLSETVSTSGRKFRAHSGWELLVAMGRLGLLGQRGVRSRTNMAIWYDQRREDPDLERDD
jgi:glycosyltransferase involved in cell wall biosynthesis